MLEVITGYGNCLKYKDQLIQKFKRKSLNSKLYAIISEESGKKQKFTAQIHFNPIKKNYFNLNNCILWYENRLLEGRYEYYFGLNSENNLEILSDDPIKFKENFSLKINYDNITESQLVFAKDTETLKIYLLIKLDLNNLSESDLNYFINKYSLFQSNEPVKKHHYYLNLGYVYEEDTVFNFFSFISEVRIIDNTKPYLKIIYTKNDDYESFEDEKEFIEKLQYETKTKKIDKDTSEFIIRTKIKKNYLIPFLTRLNGYEEYISKIISTSISDKSMGIIIRFKINNSDITKIKKLFNID